jgi:hypothetical protein
MILKSHIKQAVEAHIFKRDLMIAICGNCEPPKMRVRPNWIEQFSMPICGWTYRKCKPLWHIWGTFVLKPIDLFLKIKRRSKWLLMEWLARKMILSERK